MSRFSVGTHIAALRDRIAPGDIPAIDDDAEDMVNRTMLLSHTTPHGAVLETLDTIAYWVHSQDNADPDDALYRIAQLLVHSHDTILAMANEGRFNT